MSNSAERRASFDDAEAAALGDRLRSLVDIRDRRYGFPPRTYVNCFVGRDAVQALIDESAAVDAADARRVADVLDIPFHALNFQDAFGRIKDYFADEYLAGRTPNPCVMCNNWLKFGRLWDFARQVEATHIASGHYAQVTPLPGSDQPALVRGRDRGKDQSYVLFGVDRGLLDHVLFPVGNATKSEIRGTAERAGLRAVGEFFVDRGYTGEGGLVPRGEPGALLDDPAEAAERLVRVVVTGTVRAVDGSDVAVRAESACLHGDSPGAVATARRVRDELARAGITVAPFV